MCGGGPLLSVERTFYHCSHNHIELCIYLWHNNNSSTGSPFLHLSPLYQLNCPWRVSFPPTARVDPQSLLSLRCMSAWPLYYTTTRVVVLSYGCWWWWSTRASSPTCPSAQFIHSRYRCVLLMWMKDRVSEWMGPGMDRHQTRGRHWFPFSLPWVDIRCDSIWRGLQFNCCVSTEIIIIIIYEEHCHTGTVENWDWHHDQCGIMWGLQSCYRICNGAHPTPPPPPPSSAIRRFHAIRLRSPRPFIPGGESIRRQTPVNAICGVDGGQWTRTWRWHEHCNWFVLNEWLEDRRSSVLSACPGSIAIPGQLTGTILIGMRVSVNLCGYVDTI